MSGWSGQVIFERWSIAMYNVVGRLIVYILSTSVHEVELLYDCKILSSEVHALE